MGGEGNRLKAAEIESVRQYSVAEIAFTGPHQTASDTPARDLPFAVTFRHESGSPEFSVQGFFDGDGSGGIEGNVFKARFCPTRPGKWTITDVESRELSYEGKGDHHSEADTIAAHLGAFLGGGYGTTSAERAERAPNRAPNRVSAEQGQCIFSEVRWERLGVVG